MNCGRAQTINYQQVSEFEQHQFLLYTQKRQQQNEQEDTEKQIISLAYIQNVITYIKTATNYEILGIHNDQHYNEESIKEQVDEGEINTQDINQQNEKGHRRRRKQTEALQDNPECDSDQAELEAKEPNKQSHIEEDIDENNHHNTTRSLYYAEKQEINHGYPMSQEEFDKEATSVSQNHSQLNTLNSQNIVHDNEQGEYLMLQQQDSVNGQIQQQQSQSQSNFVLVENQMHDTQTEQIANKQYQFQIASTVQYNQQQQGQHNTNDIHSSQIVISYQTNTENILIEQNNERSSMLNDMRQLNNSLKEMIKMKSEQQRTYSLKLNQQQQDNLKLSLSNLKNSKKLVDQIKKTDAYRQQLLIKSTTIKEKSNIDLFIIQNNKLQIQRVGNKIVGSINNTVVFNIPLEPQYFTFNDKESSIQFGSHYKAKFEPRQYKVHKEKLLVRMGNDELTSTLRSNVIYNETLNSIILMDDSGKFNSSVSLANSKKEDLGDGIIMIKQLTGENIVYMVQK